MVRPELVVAVAEQAIRHSRELVLAKEFKPLSKPVGPKPAPESHAPAVISSDRPSRNTSTTVSRENGAPVHIKPIASRSKRTKQFNELLPQAKRSPRISTIKEKPKIIEVTQITQSKPNLRVVSKAADLVDSAKAIAETREISHLIVWPETKASKELEKPKIETPALLVEPISIVELPEPIVISAHETKNEFQPDAIDSPEEDPHTAAVLKVVEATAGSVEVAEEAATFLIVLPGPVQFSLKEYIQASEPEAVEAIEAQIVMIAKVADRLHELVTNNEGQGEEASRIEQWLTEQYTELLNTLGVEYDEEMIKAFIELVKSEDYVVSQELLEDQEPYDPMHERHGWADLRGRQTASNLKLLLREELARFAVHHGLAA